MAMQKAAFVARRAAYLFLFIALIYLGWGFIPDPISVKVINRSSATQVALQSITIDGVKLDYQDPLLAKQTFLTNKMGRFKSTPRLHHIELWIKQENLPSKKYSCNVQGTSGGGEIGIDYLDSGIKCGKRVYMDDSPIF